MGACCNGKESRHDRIEEEIYMRQIKSHLSEKNKPCNPRIEYDVECSKFNTKLSETLLKFSKLDQSESSIKLHKITLERLWNISKFYLDDFTTAEYIILDIREKNLRNENFLKKFKHINYSIDEMNMMSENALQRFKKFLDLKNVIVILNESLIKTLEEILNFFQEKKININLYLYNQNLNEVDVDKNIKLFYDTLDTKNFKDLPFIMLSHRYFPHLKSNNYIFFDYIDENSIKSCELFSNQKYKDSELFKFYENYSTSLVMDYNKSREVNSSNTFKKFSTSKSSLNVKYIKLEEISTIKDLETKKKEIVGLIEIIKYEIQNNRSVLIKAEQNIDKEVLINLIVLIIWQVTEIQLKRLLPFLQDNLIFVNKIKTYLETNFDVMENFLKDKICSNEDINFDYKRKETDVDDLRQVKDKVNLH